MRKIHVVEWQSSSKKHKGLVRTNSEQLEIFKQIGCKKPQINDLSFKTNPTRSL
ncbi:MAG: hypothetical protein U9P79_01815 [Candidatus Cloacimonadota bacterium]|nr:hypothetical protein [Candidatus Cloacimonadota bacterium]